MDLKAYGIYTNDTGGIKEGSASSCPESEATPREFIFKQIRKKFRVCSVRIRKKSRKGGSPRRVP